MNRTPENIKAIRARMAAIQAAEYSAVLEKDPGVLPAIAARDKVASDLQTLHRNFQDTRRKLRDAQMEVISALQDRLPDWARQGKDGAK